MCWWEYGLYNRRFVVRPPAGARNMFFSKGYRPEDPPSHLLGEYYEIFLQGGGRRRMCGKADRSPRSNAEAQIKWSYTSTPPYVFKECTLTKFT